MCLIEADPIEDQLPVRFGISREALQFEIEEFRNAASTKTTTIRKEDHGP